MYAANERRGAIPEPDSEEEQPEDPSQNEKSGDSKREEGLKGM